MNCRSSAARRWYSPRWRRRWGSPSGWGWIHRSGCCWGWCLLGITGYGFVGFVDDWQKVHRGVGITEVQKFVGVLIVSLGIGIAFNRLIVTKYLSARLPYPPYSDIPLIGQVLIHAHFAWIIFFIGLTLVVGVTTPLAVDFADGIDGLCGGLLLSASLSFAVILLFQDQKDL